MSGAIAGGLAGAALSGTIGVGMGTAIAGGALLGSSVGGGIMSSRAQQSAASTAAGAQQAASEAAIAEQRRQFDEIQRVLAPYVEAGTAAIGGMEPYAAVGEPALAAQQALIGLGGPAAQAAAIRQLEQSPEMAAMVQQGENALLQQAAATGGLRGGNVQAALAQFRPQLLADLINQQYSRLGGMTTLGYGTQAGLAELGQASAAGQARAAQTTGANIGTALTQAGTAQAEAALARGAAQAGMWGGIGETVGGLGTLKLLGKF